MGITEVSQLSIDILNNYYNNNLQPFFDYCHRDILWLGPAKNQLIRTKEALVEAFGKEVNPLQFAMHNLTVTPIYSNANCMNILLSFVVDTFWPDGGSNRVFQRIILTWEIKKGQPLIRICHISNAIDYDARDSIYPVHYLENHPQMTLYSDSSQQLHFTGANRSILYTEPEQIMYMESTGNHTRLHMLFEVFECNHRLSAICKDLPEGLFIRCHASYVVNPRYVKSIMRFALIMSDGRKIPIPEKKYTKIKAKLLNAQSIPSKATSG